MATGGTPFDDSAEELHNWTVTNGSLEDRLNNIVRAGQNLIGLKKSSLFGFHIMLPLEGLPLLYSHIHYNFGIQSFCPVTIEAY